MKNTGFTLVEVLVVIAILIIISALTFASFFNLDDRQALDVSVKQIDSFLEEARSLTLASKDASQYGVHFDTESITRFRGSVYSETDPDNVVSNLHNKIQISDVSLSGGGNEVIFDRLTGNTSQSGTITISLKSDPTQTRIITIEATGIVQ